MEQNNDDLMLWEIDKNVKQLSNKYLQTALSIINMEIRDRQLDPNKLFKKYEDK